MTNLKLIGRGRTAEIFEWPDNRVLKLFNAGWTAEQVQVEADASQAVYATGLPIPAMHGLANHAGRHGIVYERVDGPTLLQHMTAQPWRLLHAGRLLAELHHQIHTRTVAGLPSQRENLTQAIASASGLTDEMRGHAHAALAQLPDADALCHGDFHPENVVLSQRGPIIIDWVTATQSHPLADVARTSLLLRIASPPSGSTVQRLMIGFGRALFHRMYLQRYLLRSRKRLEDLAKWGRIVGIARLNEGIVDEREQLLRMIAV